MAWWKYLGCGHLSYVDPPRSMHQTPKEGKCAKCRRREELGQTIVKVTLRRIVFVAANVKR